MTAPIRHRTRRTQGSRAVADFVDRHGLRPVAVYLPEKLHRALTATALEHDTSMQSFFTLACNKYYGGICPDVPELLAPTHVKRDPHKSCTWYADVNLHHKMKLLAVETDGSVQQLIVSAVVDYLKDAPRVKALHLRTGYPAYARAPERLPRLPRALAA